MSRIKSTPCLYCEGTGEKLNWFDPLNENVMYGACNYVWQVDKNKTISGREILNEPCPNCNGALKVYYI